MPTIPFDSNDPSNLSFSFAELVVIANAAANAIEHSEYYLQEKQLSDEQRDSIESAIDDFQDLSDKVCAYLDMFSDGYDESIIE